MRAAASAEDLLRQPLGRYVAGKSFVVWVQGPRLAGAAYFGRPAPADHAALGAMFPLAQHASLRAPFDVLVDASAGPGMDTESFSLLLRYIGTVEVFTERLGRVSCVRPGGMVGATLTGVFYDLAASRRLRLGLFTDRVEGLRWLGEGARDAAAEIEELLAAVQAEPPLVAAVRRDLESDCRTAHIEDVARRLGMSARSLQRGLAAAGTSFRAEVERARVRATEALLVDGEEKLEVIARRVGYASASQLGTMFRRATGETPGEFRARRRSAGG